MEQSTTDTSKKDLLSLLEDLSSMATGNRTLELLEEIEQNRDDPNYKPPTFGELFGTEDGLNIFGELLPDDIEGLADEPVTSDWLRGPLRSIAVNKRRLAKGAQQLEKAQEDFKKRAQRRARAHVRKTPGGTKHVRQYLQSLGVRDLNLFSAGTAKNRLVFGSRTRMHVGVIAPVQAFDLATELDAAGVSGENAEAREKFELQQLRHFEGLVLDHTSAIGMAIGSAVGHDRVDRKITMTLTYNDLPNGTTHTRRRITENGKQTDLKTGNLVLSDEALTQLKRHEDAGEEVPAVLEVTLDYSFQLAKSRVNDTIEMLQLVSGQPIFRGLSLSATDEDDELAGLSATPGSLDTLLDDDSDDDSDDDTEQTSQEWSEEDTKNLDEAAAASYEEVVTGPNRNSILREEPAEEEQAEESQEPDEPVEEELVAEEPEEDPKSITSTDGQMAEDVADDIDLTADEDDDEEDDEFADLFADIGL